MALLIAMGLLITVLTLVVNIVNARVPLWERYLSAAIVIVVWLVIYGFWYTASNMI